jgi:4-hydroxyphenylacetate 3-monooxygenase
MGIRTANEFLKGLADNRVVYFGGERVKDVTKHPGLDRGAKSMAALLQRQHDKKLQDLLSYPSDDGKERYAMSFLEPKSKEDVARRGAAMYDWSKWSCGMMGRTPDYLNSSLMAFSAASDYFAQCRPDFSDNVKNYYQKVRNNDLVLTHTLVNPQVNRQITADGTQSEDVALRLIKETDAGLVVSGARLLATLGPLSDELVVFPSTVLKVTDESMPYAMAFALPNDAPGMRYICRDSYDTGKKPFDAPLSSRFEEMDAVVIFDNVTVPWERVFLYEAPVLCNKAYAETNAVVHMMHQVVCKNLAKSEFIVGLLCAMTRASERDKDGTVQGMIAEAMWISDTMRSFLRLAELDAEKDKWGVYCPSRQPLDTARNVFPKMYPRLMELVQILGSSSLMATPSEAEFSGDAKKDVERYFHLANLKSRDRVALFRLAQDVAVSGFGSRQMLYERFFFGPPDKMASAYFNFYDKTALMDRVQDMLSRA